MTTNKITRKELFTELLNLEAVQTNPLWKEKLEAEIVAIDKKNANRKPTAQQVENENIKAEILEKLSEAENGLTVSQLMKLTTYGFKSNQQCTALLRQLRLDGLVSREERKDATYYCIVVGE